MPGEPFLRADRVELRTLEDSEYLQWTRNAPEFRVRSGGPPEPFDGHDTEGLLDLFRRDHTHGLTVCLDGEYVGMVTLKKVWRPAVVADEGVHILSEQQGNGYATEACRLLYDGRQARQSEYGPEPQQSSKSIHGRLGDERPASAVRESGHETIRCGWLAGTEYVAVYIQRSRRLQAMITRSRRRSIRRPFIFTLHSLLMRRTHRAHPGGVRATPEPVWPRTMRIPPLRSAVHDGI